MTSSPWSFERGPLVDKYDPWLPLLIRARQAPSFVTAKDVWQSGEPFSIYVHIPFCLERCHYCDFTSYVNCAPEVMKAYTEALKREIELYGTLPHFQNRQVSALYFGGGTPTHIPNELLSSIVSQLHTCFDFTPDYEFSLESNPSDIDEEKLDLLREVGVNRLSMGVQSFNDLTLRAMNRSHSCEQAIAAIKLAKARGFSINIDLIYGYPGQDFAGWCRSLDWAIELEVGRLTCTSLTVWPKTAVHHQLMKGKVARVDENLERAMFDTSIDKMLSAGYEQGTVLSFNSSPNNSWRMQRDVLTLDQEMMGLGASAFSLSRDWAYVNVPFLKNYIQTLNEGNLPIVIGFPIDANLAMSLMIAQSFKLLHLDRQKYHSRFGIDVQTVYGERIRRLEANGLVAIDNDHIHLTREGMWHLGPVVREFYHSDDLAAWILFDARSGNLFSNG